MQLAPTFRKLEEHGPEEATRKSSEPIEGRIMDLANYMILLVLDLPHRIYDKQNLPRRSRCITSTHKRSYGLNYVVDRRGHKDHFQYFEYQFEDLNPLKAQGWSDRAIVNQEFDGQMTWEEFLEGVVTRLDLARYVPCENPRRTLKVLFNLLGLLFEGKTIKRPNGAVWDKVAMVGSGRDKTLYVNSTMRTLRIYCPAGKDMNPVIDAESYLKVEGSMDRPPGTKDCRFPITVAELDRLIDYDQLEQLHTAVMWAALKWLKKPSAKNPLNSWTRGGVSVISIALGRRG